MIHHDKSSPILLLIADQQTRHNLFSLLTENQLLPRLMGDQKELLRELKKTRCATVLIDCGAVGGYGTGIISKIKVACQHSRIIVFCAKEHLPDSQHREIIKEILAIGVYACVMAPYKGWEVISLAGPGKK